MNLTTEEPRTGDCQALAYRLSKMEVGFLCSVKKGEAHGGIGNLDLSRVIPALKHFLISWGENKSTKSPIYQLIINRKGITLSNLEMGSYEIPYTCCNKSENFVRRIYLLYDRIN